MNTTERQDFVQKLKEAAQRGPDDAEFASLIGQAVDDLSEAEMSKLLQVSRPTINRWKNGRSVPHPLGRPRVMQKLAERTQALLKASKAPRLTRPQSAETEVAAE